MSAPARLAADHRGVWVFAEQREGVLQPVSLELTGLGRRLADQLNTPLEVVLLGDGVGDLAEELIACGADRVLLGEHPLLRDYQTDCYTRVLAGLILGRGPEIVLIGSTSNGRDLAPRLSTRLRTGLMADCIDFEVDPASRILTGIKPVAGSGLLASIICPQHRPQIVTARPGVLPRPASDPSRKGEVRRPDIELGDTDARTRLLRTVRDSTGGARLDDAPVVVAAGQGVGCEENLCLLEQLAEVLGAALGATRPVVDAGWLPESAQIGQSGKSVRPRLYIACGVHGASFHTVGMQNSDVIVAINDDPQAPIFQIATLGVVGDLREIVPLLTDRLKHAGLI